MITLTLREIRDLADFAGLAIAPQTEPDADDMETLFTITDCPPEGITNEGEPSDQDSVSHYNYIAYCTDCPEEGCIGLGPEIDPPTNMESPA